MRTTCRVCDRSFHPTRCDSLYCSAACKQKSYRQRLSGNTDDNTPSVTDAQRVTDTSSVTAKRSVTAKSPSTRPPATSSPRRRMKMTRRCDDVEDDNVSESLWERHCRTWGKQYR
jgi:hypothetical protein